MHFIVFYLAYIINILVILHFLHICSNRYTYTYTYAYMLTILYVSKIVLNIFIHDMLSLLKLQVTYLRIFLLLFVCVLHAIELASTPGNTMNE